MDIQFWIWVIIIVITLIARSTRKKPAPFDQDSYEEAGPPPETKPISFEDLLREIQASKAPKPPPSVQQAPTRNYDFEDYDDEIEEEPKSLEKTSYDYRHEDKIYETYEKAKQEAFSRASLEETMKVENTEVTYSQFKEFKRPERQSLAAVLAQELRHPANFKKAFILSEILNRKF
jgi:catalase